jgi:hypothetical protein
VIAVKTAVTTRDVGPTETQSMLGVASERVDG